MYADALAIIEASHDVDHYCYANSIVTSILLDPDHICATKTLNWIPRIKELHTQEPLFYVRDGHLFTKEGILYLLIQYGYRIKRMNIDGNWTEFTAQDVERINLEAFYNDIKYFNEVAVTLPQLKDICELAKERDDSIVIERVQDIVYTNFPQYHSDPSHFTLESFLLKQ